MSAPLWASGDAPEAQLGIASANATSTSDERWAGAAAGAEGFTDAWHHHDADPLTDSILGLAPTKPWLPWLIVAVAGMIAVVTAATLVVVHLSSNLDAQAIALAVGVLPHV